MECKTAEDVAWEDTFAAQLEREQYIERDGQRLRVLVVTWVGEEVWAYLVRDNSATWQAVPYQAVVEIEEG